METLAQQPTPTKVSTKCRRGCGRRVIEAVDERGQPIAVEWCVNGKGTLALTGGLFTGQPLMATRATATRYREHSCPARDVTGRAFSAANFAGKKAEPAPAAARGRSRGRR